MLWQWYKYRMVYTVYILANATGVLYIGVTDIWIAELPNVATSKCQDSRATMKWTASCISRLSATCAARLHARSS